MTRKECVEQSRRISGKTSTSQLGQSTSRTKRKFTPFMVHQTPIILNLQCRIMFLFFTLALSFPADSQTQWSDRQWPAITKMRKKKRLPQSRSVQFHLIVGRWTISRQWTSFGRVKSRSGSCRSMSRSSKGRGTHRCLETAQPKQVAAMLGGCYGKMIQKT